MFHQYNLKRTEMTRIYEPRHDKTSLRGFEPGLTQTDVYSQQKMTRGLSPRLCFLIVLKRDYFGYRDDSLTS